jgi:hypothetical protein
MNQGYPERWPKLIPLRTGWQVLPKGRAADEEKGRTPDLVSDESAPNHSARTHGLNICLYLGARFLFPKYYYYYYYYYYYFHRTFSLINRSHVCFVDNKSMTRHKQAWSNDFTLSNFRHVRIQVILL